MRKRGAIALLLTTILIGSSVIPLQAGELEDAIKKQEQIEQQEQKARGQLNQLTYTADKLKTQINDLVSQIADAQNNLNQKQTAYNKAQKEVTLSEEELKERKEELNNRQEVLRKRVREIYQEGQISYLEILFQSENLSDFITRLEYFNRLVNNDQKILSDITKEKARIEQKTEELQARRNEAAKLQTQAAQAKMELDGKKQQHQVALNTNKKAQDAIFDQIEKMEADSNALAAKIRQLTATSTGKVHGTISTYPVPGYREISDSYGWRIHPITKKKSLHTGTDIPAPTGTKVLAAGTGVVILAGWYGAYGNAVIIDHGGGYTSLYGHNSRLGVSVGDSVKAGETIAYVGSTGWSTGPHLHFEVRVNGEPTDPLRFFR
jgi:murein DD-endopeptidase MepM/ murein hydrolase activator NlpD